MPQGNRRVAIIGAGVCGLNCARHLDLAGWDVDVFEKSRGSGGRLAVKRIDGLGSVDLGAQFMTAQTVEFRSLIEAEAKAGRVAQWHARVAYLGARGLESATAQKRWVGVPGMNSWLEALWPRSRVKFGQQIGSLRRTAENTWQLDDHSGPYQCVILAIPPAQAAALAIDTDLEAPLKNVAMNPCWAALALFEAPLDLTFDAAFVRIGGLDWIAANHSKPGRTTHPAAWTLHAGPLLSRQILELPDHEVAPHLLEALGTALGRDLPKVQIAVTHKWRYASPATPGADGVIWRPDLGLGAGGDWAVGGRVEGAFTAGRLLAEAVRDSL